MEQLDIHKLDIHEVLKRLPHRYPFLLVDRIIELVPDQSLVGLKNVSINEPFFQGHFPQRPVMPGVLIVESLAQACGVLVFVSRHAQPDAVSLYYLAGIDNARFKRVVEPGDQLHLHVKLLKERQDVWKFEATATVNGDLACSVELTTVKKELPRD